MKLLTEKQKQFCDEYIITENAANAASKAGYSKVTAKSKSYKFPKLPQIKKYIDQAKDPTKNPKIATSSEVLETLTTILRDEAENTRDMLTAAEKLAKRYALFSENPESDNKIEITLSEELDKLAEWNIKNIDYIKKISYVGVA